MAILSERPEVAATVRVLQPGHTPRAPAPAEVLIEAPIPNARPGTGLSARFETHRLDISRWFNAAQPLHSPAIQVQFRQHTTREGFGYFTLIGDVRTGP
jgi:hypothetical protein